MGNNFSSLSLNLCNFEKVQSAIKNDNLIINTLKESKQECLIKGTINISKEVEFLNECLKNKKDIEIIIYGKNCSDKTVLTKYNQLNNLGFTNVGIYIGGMFEWLLLQDIYGNENFPTTTKEIDILKYN